MKNLRKIVLLICVVCCIFGCSKSDSKNDKKSLAVFVPGVVSGNPVYEMLVSGVEKACTEAGESAELTVIEAGTNQAEWAEKLTALASSGKYDGIISSNPSLPALVEPLTEQFPSVKWLLLDGYLEGNPNVATLRYNQREQGYIAGYVAGLVTTSSMDYANPAKKIALIAAQEYPVMNEVILPAFAEGAAAVDSSITVEFKVVGSWADAEKASELARALYKDGVDVILPICGAGSQGVIAAAKELGFYITWFDDNGYNKAPGYVVSSTIMKQADAAYEVTKAFLEGKTEFGTAKTVGIKEGYVSFVGDDINFTTWVDKSVQEAILAEYGKIVSGEREILYP